MKRIFNTFIYLSFFLIFGCSSSIEPVKSPNQMVASKIQQKLYVADETANRITILNIENSKVDSHILLEDKPGGLVLSKDESKLYVTLSIPQGRLLEIDLATKKVIRSILVGHTPMSPVISPDGKIMYLCNRFNNNICKINLNSFFIEKIVQTDREPVDITLAEKGKLLFVANHLPNGKANAGYHSAKVSVFNAVTFELLNELSLPNGSNSLNQIEVSPDENFAYVTHVLARYNVPTNQVERGWINTNALSIIDIQDTSYLCTIMLDNLDRGAANPYDVKCSADGKKLFVSFTGTNELNIIDRKALHRRISQITNEKKQVIYAQSLEEIQNDLSFLQDIRTRIDLPGKGTKGLALYNDKVFVSMYYSGSVSEIDVSKSNSLRTIEFGIQPEPDQIRLGEIYFNDAALCKQHWQSCTSCHPGDARVDGLNWDLLNDGIGNPKNTKSMLLAHSTPPSMITGIRASANFAVRAGIEHILFTHQPEKIANAIDAYLINLKPVPSPYLVDGKFSEAAKRGKEVFEKAHCSHCHSGPYYTNLEKYDVGEGTGLEKGRKFDTPTLVEVWRTAPYLYDGKAQNMKELFTTYNSNQQHGITADLSVQELDDLVEYCLSL